uniref:Zinc finger MYND-type containing 12 n=1 Tax=Prolemur simus TaxID=1328070 RepID=A0A8C9A734_PROSS
MPAPDSPADFHALLQFRGRTAAWPAAAAAAAGEAYRTVNKGSAGLVSSEASLPGLQMSAFLLCPHVVPCVHKHLIEFCYTVAQKYLFEGKHEDAVPAALHSLRFRINVHGLSSVELVPPSYLLLVDCLGRIVQAEEYLFQAQWTVLKSTDCCNATHSLLHRNLGLLYMAKKNYEEARYHLANDIYFASCAFGTEDIRTSGGYFHLANIFYDLKNLDVADTLYTKVTEIWHKYLNDHYQVLLQARVQQMDLLGKRFENDTGLDEAQEAEAIRTLTSVLSIRESTFDKAPQKTIFVLKTLVMLCYLMMNYSKAQEYARRALNLAEEQLRDVHEQNAIQELLRLISAEDRPIT